MRRGLRQAAEGRTALPGRTGCAQLGCRGSGGRASPGGDSEAGPGGGLLSLPGSPNPAGFREGPASPRPLRGPQPPSQPLAPPRPGSPASAEVKQKAS